MTLEEQLEQLKTEQAEAEMIYQGRMELGTLTREPESIQELAKTILERQNRIDDLEKQIAEQVESPSQDIKEEVVDNEEMALTKYQHNPILNWLQQIINKMENFSRKLEEKLANRKSRSSGPKVFKTNMEEYQDIMDTNFSGKIPKNNTWELESDKLNEIRQGQEEIAKKYEKNEVEQVSPTAEKSDSLSK